MTRLRSKLQEERGSDRFSTKSFHFRTDLAFNERGLSLKCLESVAVFLLLWAIKWGGRGVLKGGSLCKELLMDETVP